VIVPAARKLVPLVDDELVVDVPLPRSALAVLSGLPSVVVWLLLEA